MLPSTQRRHGFCVAHLLLETLHFNVLSFMWLCTLLLPADASGRKHMYLYHATTVTMSVEVTLTLLPPRSTKEQLPRLRYSGRLANGSTRGICGDPLPLPHS